MSAAEIADNKWELESTKPPVSDMTGISQMVLMGGFGLFFVLIVIGALVALVSPKSEGLAGEYKKMGSGAAAQAAADAEGE